MSLFELQAGSGVMYPHFTRKMPLRREYAAALLFAITIAFFAFSLSVFLFSLPSKSSAKSAVPTAAPVLAAAALVSHANLPQEVHIANNGLVLLRGAKVVSVSGSTFTLSTTWSSNVFIWTIRTNVNSIGAHNYGTRFFDHSGDAIDLNTIQPGGFVTVTGMLDNSAKDPTIDADTVRSLQ
jgi:hypothetical protein